MRDDLVTLRRMFDPASPPATDFEAFRRDWALMTSRLVLLGAALSILFWMPTDLFVYGSDTTLMWMVMSFRISFVLLAGLSYLAALQTPREHALGVVMAFYVILVAFSFCVLGFIATPSVPFAFTSFFVPSITMVFPYKFGERAFAAFLASFLALLTYYAPHPEYMAFSYTGIIFIFLTFTTASTVGFGHLLFIFQRAMFDQRLRAQKQALELAEANRTKDTFVATVSHELRTPMNAILGLTDAIIEEKEIETIHRYARTIQQSGDLLLGLINDILDLAKIRAGRLELSPSPTQLSETVERTAALFMVQCRNKGLHLSVQVPDAAPLIEIDAARFQQIVTNLLGNAVKYTDKGAVIVAVRLDVGASDSATLHVDVIDTGPGVPEDKREAIFQEFVRVESTQQTPGGTGLGLPIVRRLARLMGGDVTLTANPTGGSIFTLTLPVSTVAGQRTEALASIPPRRARQDEWFLLCASDAVRRMALWELLSLGNRQGRAVTSLAAAEEVVLTLSPEDAGQVALVIDEPSLSAEMLGASRLMGGDGRLHVPVLMLRDVVSEAEKEAFDAIGVARVLAKPVVAADVTTLLSSTTSTARASEAVVAPRLPTQRVLVVDDVAENRLVMDVFLRRTDCEVVFASDGLEGLERFRTGRFDIVFLDIEMPRMNGYEALREMRRWEEAEGKAATRVVALTAHATSDHQQRIRDAGFSAHLTKPIRRPDLYALLTASAEAAASKAPSPFALPPPALVPDEEAVDPELAVLRVEYLRDKQESLAMLREWLSQERFPDLASLGHRWQGSGSSYGYPQITRLGAKLEEAARHQDATRIDAVIAEAFALLAPGTEAPTQRAVG